MNDFLPMSSAQFSRTQKVEDRTPSRVRLIALIFLAVCECAVAAETNTMAKAIPISVFNENAQRGVDPFFPESVRRFQHSAPRSTNAIATVTSSMPLYLKGISGSNLQRLALINNSTLAAGESGEIRLGTQTIKIRCREIRERSVFIQIEPTGEVKELKLREGI